MDRKLEHMIYQLKGKTFPESLLKEFARYGDKGFEALFSLVSNQEASDKEISNALYVMQSMCSQPCVSRSKELFDLSLSMLCHKSQLVRSRAVKVVIGMLRLYENYPTICDLKNPNMQQIVCLLTEAKALGIDKETESYLDWWLENKRGHDLRR